MPAGSEPVTGQVFNGSANFNGNTFLFATENGTIAGWRGALGTTAEQVFSSNTGAVYKGLGINDTKDLLYAADFRNGGIDVYNSAGIAGSFFDPTLPAGYAPFNVQDLGGTFYVTFAQQDAAKHDDVSGTGHGLVDIFDPATGNVHASHHRQRCRRNRGCPELALGTGIGAQHFWALRRRSPGRQLRQRRDQRLQSDDGSVSRNDYRIRAAILSSIRDCGAWHSATATQPSIPTRFTSRPAAPTRIRVSSARSP